MIHRLIAYSLILLGTAGTIYMGFEGIYGDRYETPRLSLASLNRQIEDSVRIVLIDVRTSAEIENQSAPWQGVINIPLLDLEAESTDLSPYLRERIVVLCPTGNRSAEGARILRSSGFNAAYVEHGMFELKKKRGV